MMAEQLRTVMLQARLAFRHEDCHPQDVVQDNGPGDERTERLKRADQQAKSRTWWLTEEELEEGRRMVLGILQLRRQMAVTAENGKGRVEECWAMQRASLERVTATVQWSH